MGGGFMSTDIAQDLAEWRRSTDSIFNRMLSGTLWPLEQLSGLREPLMDLEETDEEYVLTMDVPGVERKDIHVRPRDRGVEVEARKTREVKEEVKGLVRHEREFEGYYRYCMLGEAADIEHAKATLKGGVLELRIPKIAGKVKRQKEIEVR